MDLKCLKEKKGKREPQIPTVLGRVCEQLPKNEYRYMNMYSKTICIAISPLYIVLKKCDLQDMYTVLVFLMSY